MHRKHFLGRKAAFARYVLSVALLAAAVPASAGSRAGGERPPVRHDLTVRLHPERQALEAVDRITVGPPAATGPIRLSPRARVEAVALDGEDVAHTFRNGRLQIAAEALAGRSGPAEVTVRYRAVFDDPAPVRPLNTDNPGFGVTGTISDRGTFLLAGSGWYPEVDGAEAAFRIRVEAPEGTLAVTAGKNLGHFTQDGRSVSVWDVRRTLRGLSLSAGPYVVTEERVGKVRAATYFFPENRPLAAGYLDAVGRYLRLYAERFGPYPFEKFAVVENFFPTGYGFPSYTLLGSRVLRLPFIKDTSLGHEIAHCWWGNGVLVDPADGNWSEGLTTYVADYLYKEMASEAAAADYRRQILRDYASLVDPGEDFALERFRSRTDPVTRVVGYGKAAMVFHMLRREIGEEAFWGALRDVYEQRLFRPTGWEDLRRAFEARSGRSLAVFFRQWVRRPGAVRLLAVDAARERSGDRWRIAGALRQETPPYRISVDVGVAAGERRRTQSVSTAGGAAAFTVETGFRPERIMLDPDHHLFRRLYPSEIPPSVNAIRGASPVRVVLGAGGGETVRKAARMLVRALGLRDARLEAEPDLPSGTGPMLIVGAPRNAALLEGMPEGVGIEGDGFRVFDERFGGRGAAVFAVFRPAGDPGSVRAVFAFRSPGAAEAAIRKIPHYGRYSYLAFTDGRNRAKGVWPVEDSPLIQRFPPP